MMFRNNISFLIALLLFFASFNLFTVNAQDAGKKDHLRLMFYNVENFFDTEDDPTTNDNEFTPEGQKRWTTNRYIEKRNAIFKVIANVGEWEPPAMIALCEIENRKILNDLIINTPLSKYPYKIVHKDSPDQRGIDVALLYRNDYLKPLKEQFVRIRFSDNRKRTRDILYATMKTTQGDTLHIFVNHWPSRTGGDKKSEPSRILAASVLREKVDSIFNRNPQANIIITGDFNDSPTDKSVRNQLKALTDTTNLKPATLVNLSAYKMKEKTGTIKYQSAWSVFDQIIVSNNLLNRNSKIKTNVSECYIFRADYLFEPDKRYSGIKPFRTYSGNKYIKGYSDHLPVYIDLFFQK